MRGSTLVLVLALVLGAYLFGLPKPRVVNSVTNPATAGLVPQLQATQTSASTAPAKVDFTTHVRPILESRCMPCHFQGGTMYQRLPFDQPKTIKSLGEKLFTRIKNENEKLVIREFLTQ